MLFEGWHNLISGVHKGWIQTEACVIPRDANPVAETEANRDTINVAAVPNKQKWSVQPKLKHNNVRLFR